MGSERILKEDSKICDQKRMQEEARLIGVNWSFNPPYASHFGGAWERQIRTVRKIMKNMSPGAVYTDHVLQTVLCEVENVINSRPLSLATFLEVEEKPLTPADFLTPDCSSCVPLPPSNDKDVHHERRYVKTKFLINKAREPWIKKFMPSIAPRSKWLNQKRNAKVGDLVYIVNEARLNHLGQLDKIIQTFPDSKGLVRSVRLMTKNGKLVGPIVKVKLFLPVEEGIDEHVPSWLAQ